MRKEGNEIMKKIGTYTARGKLSEDDSEAGNPATINLQDGNYDTAYVVTDFRVFGASSGGSTTGDSMGKLATSKNVESGPGDFFNANDEREIAWSMNSASTDSGASGGFGERIVDPNNIVVDDLYVFIRGSQDSQSQNYIVHMDKYKIDEWVGALAMARDAAMGGAP